MELKDLRRWIGERLDAMEAEPRRYAQNLGALEDAYCALLSVVNYLNGKGDDVVAGAKRAAVAETLRRSGTMSVAAHVSARSAMEAGLAERMRNLVVVLQVVRGIVIGV